MSTADDRSVITRPDAATTQHRTAEDIEEWLVTRISYLAEIPKDSVDVHAPFVDYRLDSSVAVSVTAELAAWLGTSLPITLFWEHPSIFSLAEKLASTNGTA